MELLDFRPTLMLPHSFSNVPIQNISHQENISGTVLNNRYAIQKVLGRGGIGLTYLAFDSHRFNDVCVIKEFAPSKLFQQQLKQGQTFSESEIMIWLKNVLPILDYIHQRGIVHRDISPDNILKSAAGNLPILIDFGVGKQSNFSTQEITNNSINQSHTPTLVGKTGYAPWEQLALGQCFPCSDLYSLGVTAIVLLTGKQPTQLIDDSLQWQWRDHTKVSDAFAQIIEQFVAYNPQQRYQSAQEALTALNSLHTTSIKSVYFKSYSSPKPKIEKPKLLNSASTSDRLAVQFTKYYQDEYKFALF